MSTIIGMMPRAPGLSRFGWLARPAPQHFSIRAFFHHSQMFGIGPVLAKRSHRAEWSEAPSTYEMEGASSGVATLDRLVARPTQRRVPPAGTGYPREVPVSRLLPRPGVAPGWFPFPTVKYFYCFLRRSRKGVRQFISSFFLSTRCPQNDDGCPHMTVVIHRHMHSSSTGYPT